MQASGARLPLMVGVTGHRDLLDSEVPRLEQAVQDFFLDLQRRFPDLPLLVTTPLAEGADRLVARVARRLDIPLNFLLPMPLDTYEHDFAGVSAEVFEETIRQGTVIELPLLQDLPSEGGLPEGTTRDAQYEYLGIYLAAHSHILLALWDGKPSQAPGGTAQVVRFHQENIVRLLSGVEARSAVDFSEDESDLAFHVVCSRESGGAPASGLSPGDSAWLTRDDVQPRTRELPARYETVFRQQQQLNRDLATAAGSTTGADALPDHPEAAIAAEIGTLTEAVDALAVHFQKRALLTLRSLYALAGLAGISFIAYADVPDQDGMIWAYLGFLTLGLVLYVLERRGAWYRRYLDYRGLAVGLQVQGYWAMAGVRPENPTEFAHDRFMRREELSLGWIRNVMRYAGRLSDAADVAPSASALQAIVDHWIRAQHDYYRRRLAEHLRRARFTDAANAGGFALGLAAAVVLAFFQRQFDALTVNTLIAGMVGLPFLAAVRASYGERICERELIAQYARMERIFENARRLLLATDDSARRRDVLRGLGEEALQEVGQWLLRQRERPVSGGQLFRTG